MPFHKTYIIIFISLSAGNLGNLLGLSLLFVTFSSIPQHLPYEMQMLFRKWQLPIRLDFDTNNAIYISNISHIVSYSYGWIGFKVKVWIYKLQDY